MKTKILSKLLIFIIITIGTNGEDFNPCTKKDIDKLEKYYK